MRGACVSVLLGVALAAGLPALSQQTGYSGHGAESVSPELIVKYAAPPLDASVSRRIQAMLDVRAPGLGLVSEDGSRLYFGWRITGTPQVFRLTAPKGFPVQMTGGEDRTSILAITPDGKSLVLGRDVGGQENPGIYLQSADGGSLLTIQKIDKVQTFLDFVTEDGKELYFHANDVAPDTYAIYRYDLASRVKTSVFSEKGLWEVADHAGQGADLRLLLVKATGSFAREFAEYVPATKKLTSLLGAGETTEYDAAYPSSRSL